MDVGWEDPRGAAAATHTAQQRQQAGKAGPWAAGWVCDGGSSRTTNQQACKKQPRWPVGARVVLFALAHLGCRLLGRGRLLGGRGLGLHEGGRTGRGESGASADERLLCGASARRPVDSAKRQGSLLSPSPTSIPWRRASSPRAWPAGREGAGRGLVGVGEREAADGCCVGRCERWRVVTLSFGPYLGGCRLLGDSGLLHLQERAGRGQEGGGGQPGAGLAGGRPPAARRRRWQRPHPPLELALGAAAFLAATFFAAGLAAGFLATAGLAAACRQKASGGGGGRHQILVDQWVRPPVLLPPRR